MIDIKLSSSDYIVVRILEARTLWDVKVQVGDIIRFEQNTSIFDNSDFYVLYVNGQRKGVVGVADVKVIDRALQIEAVKPA